MDDFQVVIYIILVVVYIISRAMKAKKKADQSVPHIPPTYKDADAYTGENPKPYQPSAEPGKVTFEDLLKEFSGYSEKEPDIVPDQPVTEQVSMPEEIKDVPDYLSYKTPKEYKPHIFEEPKSLETLVSYEDMYKKAGVVESSDIKHIDPNQSRFTEYADLKGIDIHKAPRFKRLLSSSRSIKDAVILKEILDRKYF